MSSALEYVILSHDADEQGEKRRKLLLFHGALPSLEPAFYAQLVELEPMVDCEGKACPALALVDYDEERMLLVTLQPSRDREDSFTDHYVFIPADALVESAVQLERWLAFLPEVSHDINVTLPLLQPPEFTAIECETRADQLEQILDQLPADSFEHVLALLGAVMDKRTLLIPNYPADFSQRLALVSGIQALLPGKLAARMTFASHAPIKSEYVPQLAFVDTAIDDSPWVYDWQHPQLLGDAAAHPYIDVLRTLWQGDVPALAAEIQQLAGLCAPVEETSDLASGLERLAERYWLDRHVQTEDEVSTELMIRILEGASPPSQELRQRYIEKLLHNALQNRDAAAGRQVAQELEGDVELENSFAGVFDEMLENQPDAVYVFIRNRLLHLGLDEGWIARLQTAGRNSLEVAIQEGDAGTLAGWLELIAHEPLSYQLQDILREGILEAKTRAYDDGELGIHLILIAARRVPEIVDDLYNDEQLIDALETNVRKALQSASAESLERLIDEKAEYFLLALYHGIKVTDKQLVTAASVERLWTLYESEEKVDLPALYRAPELIRLLATQATHQMSDDALGILFDRIINCDDRQLIADAIQHFAERELLFPRLTNALESDRLPLDKVLSIMNIVSGIKSAAARDVIDTYFDLLDYYQWIPPTQRMMEALARMMAKHHEVQVSYRNLWKLFDSCHELQIEGAARVSISQLVLQYAEEEDLTVVVDGIARICRQIAWSDSLQETVNAWWRDYTQVCTLPHLQRLQRELDSQRHLEPQKHILKTALAMRRWLHSRDSAQFAEAINTTFTILEHITEAFDEAHFSEIDSRTIRREVDAASRGLSSEERHILANNLRNIAQRITQMAEKRSKPSLIRSDDSIDRQLTQGEASPHGSIDMMKWIAGYLDGAHPHTDD